MSHEKHGEGGVFMFRLSSNLELRRLIHLHAVRGWANNKPWWTVHAGFEIESRSTRRQTLCAYSMWSSSEHGYSMSKVNSQRRDISVSGSDWAHKSRTKMDSITFQAIRRCKLGMRTNCGSVRHITCWQGTGAELAFVQWRSSLDHKMV